jgi:hypothetical protein
MLSKKLFGKPNTRNRQTGIKCEKVALHALVTTVTLALSVCVPSVGFLSAASRQTAPAEQDPAVKRVFADFGHRVDAYQKLRGDLEHKLPALKPTDNPDAIVAHQAALAKEIANARKNAKRGDIFTVEISQQFRKLIRDAFKSAKGPEIHKTIRQGEPTSFALRVNEVYPADTPVTTMPPTLLNRLPKLPSNLEYRLVGSAFVLEDIKARLVVDFFDQVYAQPQPPH